MAEHILMKRATRRPYSEIREVEHGIRYDAERGYWVTDHAPLVTTQEFRNGAHSTKKCDQETGEDQKEA